MSSQEKSDAFCLECHWEAFHLDGRSSMESSNPTPQAQWNCPGDEHHTSLAHCGIDEACCDVDDCSVNCDSVCDGFVDCDASTVCSVAHCEDNNCDDNCESTGPVCFDEHCFGNDESADHGLESLLGLDTPLALETNDLLSPTTVGHTQVNQPAKLEEQALSGTLDPHSTNALFPPYPTPAHQCNYHASHHFQHYHDFSKDSNGDLTGSCYPSQTEVNPAEVFHMLGMCSDFSSCHDYHVPENTHCQDDMGKLNEDTSLAPFTCFHPGYHHHLNLPVKRSSDTGTNSLVKGVCRSHHRCRNHVHAHVHPYSPYSRHHRSSVSSHLMSSPGETPPPLEGGASSILTSPDFPSEENDLHICRWTTTAHGIKSTCGATFPDPGALQEHLISSHMTTVDGAKGNGYYCCWDGCHRPNEPFSQKSKLQGHFLTHSNYKNFQCSVCGKLFARQATLDRHERSHRGEKPYKCKECGKSFTDSSELKTHMRTHTGEKPFKCNFPGCNFETGDSSNMSSHRLTHGERKHKCHFPGCSKSFTRPDQLKRHLKTTHKQEGSILLSPSPVSPLADQFTIPSFSAIS